MRRTLRSLIFSVMVTGTAAGGATAESRPTIDTSRGDRMIAAYFRAETAKLTRRSLADIKTLADWKNRQQKARQKLFEMLGLYPRPPRTPLKPVVTGKIEAKEFVVENLQFQSRPGLYVTGNLYVPKKRPGKLPAILYVCGHGGVKKNGISYGNKTHYQHHGEWFARNGYVCLTIDTVQLGEIEGIHHGTYNRGMWWWNARGYTPAGVEAWNGIRAIDYLQSRPEVDAERIGVTGRSGGGAYSWWIAALDERIKVAVPVAGITSLKNHVVDGTVEGHCDCMFEVNTYRWDFPQVAALIAPRPLLIENSDKDRIFPLDGVVDVYTKTRRIYELYGVPRHIGLVITEGPHQDTQQLRVPAFHWFNKFLKGKDPLIDTTAVPMFPPEKLKVFQTLPTDEKNTTIQETFVRKAPAPELPANLDEWNRQKTAWMAALRTRCFRGWPGGGDSHVEALSMKKVFTAEHDGLRLSGYDFTSQGPIRLRLFLAQPSGKQPSRIGRVILNPVDQQGWTRFLAMARPGFANPLDGEAPAKPSPEEFRKLRATLINHRWAMAWVAPRGVGPTEWTRNPRKRTQIRRRFMLLGQTRDGMRVWDVRRAVQALRQIEEIKTVPLTMQGEREMAGIALYASLFEPAVKRLELYDLPRSHRQGPIFLNILRFLDVPQAVAMAVGRSEVHLFERRDQPGWEYPRQVARKFGWNRFRLTVPNRRLQSDISRPEQRGPADLLTGTRRIQTIGNGIRVRRARLNH